MSSRDPWRWDATLVGPVGGAHARAEGGRPGGEVAWVRRLPNHVRADRAGVAGVEEDPIATQQDQCAHHADRIDHAEVGLVRVGGSRLLQHLRLDAGRELLLLRLGAGAEAGRLAERRLGLLDVVLARQVVESTTII